MEFVREDPMIWASGPVYHYSFVNELLHIDAVSQKRIGSLAARSILGLLHNEKRFQGVIPTKTTIIGNEVHIAFNVPYPPLCFDTMEVRKVANYGFNVIRRDNVDIISDVALKQDTVIIKCKESPLDCKIRYAINGEFDRCGWRIGPRGNLRDSQGNVDAIIIQGKSYPQHNWCYQFDMLAKTQ